MLGASHGTKAVEEPRSRRRWRAARRLLKDANAVALGVRLSIMVLVRESSTLSDEVSVTELASSHSAGQALIGSLAIQ